MPLQRITNLPRFSTTGSGGGGGLFSFSSVLGFGFFTVGCGSGFGRWLGRRGWCGVWWVGGGGVGNVGGGVGRTGKNGLARFTTGPQAIVPDREQDAQEEQGCPIHSCPPQQDARSGRWFGGEKWLGDLFRFVVGGRVLKGVNVVPSSLKPFDYMFRLHEEALETTEVKGENKLLRCLCLSKPESLL